MENISYPNESKAYRKARNELLKAELELRAQIERVSEQRRDLPSGGLLKEDYVFQEVANGNTQAVQFSDLFLSNKDTLFIYSFMFSPNMDGPCPMCASILDGLNGQMMHINERINLVAVAKHSPEVLNKYAKERGWSKLRLLSSEKNSYNVDYYGEQDGRQITIANVFVRDGQEIRHFYGSEMTFTPIIKENGNIMHMRHLDLIWPVWNVFDMTPIGRGS